MEERKKENYWNSCVTQEVKHPTLPLQGLRLLLWYGLEPWQGNFHMLRVKPKKEGKLFSLIFFPPFNFFPFSLLWLFSLLISPFFLFCLLLTLFLVYLTFFWKVMIRAKICKNWIAISLVCMTDLCQITQIKDI